MMENNEALQNTRTDYRSIANQMGKKEFTLLKMQEYGFWPKDLPTPYERQKDETPEKYAKREALLKEYQKVIDQITKLYEEKDEINKQLTELKKKYDETWDYEKIRLDISKNIMQESIKRRAERKAARELEKQQKSEAWQKRRAETIMFIGKGYSSMLKDTEGDDEKLKSKELPIIKTDKDLTAFLGIEYKELRFLTYHRDVVVKDHYHRYEVSKRRGGMRKIAAPKPVLKRVQKRILDEILSKIPVSNYAYGFLKGKSVVSNAQVHETQTELLINMDLEDFFPTITFERVRGMFKEFGYSGYIASLLAMLCTYCERVPIEVKGVTKYVKISSRILPQGSPASPMITNIICAKLDKRLKGLSEKFGFKYSRYADDMSFSLNEKDKVGNADISVQDNETYSKINDIGINDNKTNAEVSSKMEGRFCGMVSKIIKEEGFNVNKAKTKFLRKNNCQSITGIVINNDEIGVTKKWVKRLRAAIYNAKKLKSNGSEVPLQTINEISGMIAWLKSVNAERYKSIIEDGMTLIRS